MIRNTQLMVLGAMFGLLIFWERQVTLIPVIKDLPTVVETAMLWLIERTDP